MSEEASAWGCRWSCVGESRALGKSLRLGLDKKASPQLALGSEEPRKMGLGISNSTAVGMGSWRSKHCTGWSLRVGS